MKVLLLTGHLNPGGISRYICNLSQGLIQRGNQVYIASSPGLWQKTLKDNDAEVINVPMHIKSILSPKILYSFLRLRRRVKKAGIDIIHANTRCSAVLAALLSKNLKIPYVTAFHGFYTAKFSRDILPFAGRRSIAVSRAVKRHLMDDLGIGTDAIDVIYNGIDLVSRKKYEPLRKSWGLDQNHFILGMLGRISAEKGHNLTLQAISKISRIYRNLRLVINGSGKLLDNLSGQIDKFQLHDTVKIFNCPSDSFLDNIDILLMPSIKEGFGFSIIEAFLKKVPVIGYNTGGIAEIVRHKVNGLLFDYYTPQALSNAIEAMLTDKPLRERLVKEASSDVIYYSIERMAQETEKFYGRILWK